MKGKKMKIHFLGAAKVVTGSNILIELNDQTKMLLDCGMFQGSRQLNRLNFKPFKFNPEQIDFLLLSHAHIDHSGRIPKLIKSGFKGKIYCTKATYDLCSIMLPDSGHIQEMETEWDNRKRKRAGKPIREPLYTVNEAKNSLRYFNPVLYFQKINIGDNITIRFQDAGHILGSAMIELWIREKNQTIKLVFSGDLGRKNKPILRDPAIIEEADYLILESTYGNRIHPSLEHETGRLIPIINDTIKRNGNIIIPSFAIQRAQDIIYELNQYYEQFITVKDNSYLDVPVFIDSPLTISATEIFGRNPDCFDRSTLSLIRRGDNPLDFKNLHFSRTAQDSKALNASRESKVIISASGMCTVGRIKHHLKHNLWRKESSIVFVGYQAEGTLGRRIKDGAKKVRIFGEEIIVNAQIHALEGFSGHADRNELIQWLKNFATMPRKVFLVHGESEAINSFADLVKKELNLETVIPDLENWYEIEKGQAFASTEQIQEKFNKTLQSIEKETDEVKELTSFILEQLDQRIKGEMKMNNLDSIKNKLLELKNNGLELSVLINKSKHRKKN